MARSAGLSQPATSGVLTELAIPTTVTVRAGPAWSGSGVPEPGWAGPGRTSTDPPPLALSVVWAGPRWIVIVAPISVSSRLAVSASRTISPGPVHQRPATMVGWSIAPSGAGRPDSVC